ncbi:MAG TPA: ABC transporter permease [Opitutus sp.]|nr:ABC transporter permease [Opitutus sp.]
MRARNDVEAMRSLSLVFTNLRRHKLRASIGVAGIAFGVAAMLTILAIVNGAIGMFEHILVTDSEYLVFEKNVSDLFFSSVRDEDVVAVKTRPEVAAAHAMLFGIVSSPGYPVITCFGIAADDPRLEKAEWRAGRREDFGARSGEIFLGERAAEFLHAKPGETIAIGPTTFRVGGIFKAANGFEDGGVFLPLVEAQAYFHRPGVASVVAVKLRDRSEGAAFKRAVEAEHPTLVALEDREFSQSYNSFRILRATSWAVGVCAFLLGGLGVANTMLMSVFGRIRELAVLRVCGFSERQLGALILGEAVAIAAAGLVLGTALGAAVLALLPHVPQLQGYVQAQVHPGVALGIVGMALVTAVAGAIYPARFASRIQPVEALRYE